MLHMHGVTQEREFISYHVSANTPLDLVAPLADGPAAGFRVAAGGALRFCGSALLTALLGDLHASPVALTYMHTDTRL